MKISRAWLQTFFDTPLPNAQTLSDALTFHAFEIDGIEMRGEDDVLDVKVTANRGHDCLCHSGIAKELSAILKLSLKRNRDAILGKSDFSSMGAVSAAIDDSRCRRYIAGYIRGVKVGPSPEWLVERLAAMGQKSINNVVDATNFVMFDIGQPLHAFDAGKLTQKDGKYAISVRAARDGEKLMTLGEKEYTLNPSMLVIADTNADVAIGVAGVKGGMLASVTADTTDIIVESANFDGVSVRTAAQHMKIRTDASARFEQGLSPELAAYGMRAAAELIVQLAGGEVAGFVDVYPAPQQIVPVSVSIAQINAVLGLSLAMEDVADVLTRLALPFTQEGDTFTVTPPFERLDLLIPEDLIEEVGRIVGYDAVPAVELPAFRGDASESVDADFYRSENIRDFLTARGFSEVFISVFADRGERVVANKVDGVRPYLRTNLGRGLADALERNARNKDLLGIEQVKIFEIGTVWKDGKEKIIYDLAVEKLKRHKTAEEYKKELEVALEKPAKGMPASSALAVRYRPFSKYPFIVRDIALWVPEGTKVGEVLAVIREHAGGLLVQSRLFDEFAKDDRVSYAFRLVFQSFDRTLFDGDANMRMKSIYAAVKESGWEAR